MICTFPKYLATFSHVIIKLLLSHVLRLIPWADLIYVHGILLAGRLFNFLIQKYVNSYTLTKFTVIFC